MNATIKFRDAPLQHQEALKRSPGSDGTEYDVRLPIESIFFPLDAYGQAALEVRYLPDTNELCVFNIGNTEEPECVFSIIREEP